VGRIKAAVMLAHGGDDRRVPLAHAERMRDALEEQGQNVEWLAYPNEGHGYYQQAHRAEFYERLLAFLATHTAAQP
jgi:dipeptidyl aminopeptidase/acylaminoacyl peptidase